MDDENKVTPEADVPPETPADVTPPAPPADVPPAPEADVPPAPPVDVPGAGDAADGPVIDPNESRTGFAEAGQKVGDACKCPDGRKGVVHRYDAGLICMPLGDQE